jgi:hypothetical protein
LLKGKLKHPAFSMLLYLTLASCGQDAESLLRTDRINHAVDYRKGLTVAATDTLIYFTTGREHDPFEAFNARDSYCKYENDTLKFVLRDPDLTASVLQMTVFNDTVFAEFWEYSCTHNSNYKPIAYYLQLDKKNYEKGDSLAANIFFKGFISADNIYDFENDTVTVKGKISLKVRSSTFDIDTLKEEINLARFYDLLHQRPDTITKLRLGYSGLTKLPNELLQFKNLQELSLENNSLTNADFSILKEFKRLRSLSLQGCSLATVPKEITLLNNLEILNLYLNNLNQIPDELYNLTSLRELSIGANNLKTLSPKIANLKNLQSLETSHTDITVYPNEMAGMKMLAEIYPRDTMKYIPAVLKKYASGCDYY